MSNDAIAGPEKYQTCNNSLAAITPTQRPRNSRTIHHRPKRHDREARRTSCQMYDATLQRGEQLSPAKAAKLYLPVFVLYQTCLELCRSPSLLSHSKLNDGSVDRVAW